MQFEVIRKSHKKSIVIGIIVFIILAIVLVARFTLAKYELVKSIKIAEGTINYKVPDFKIMAMYVQKDDMDCTEDSCYNVLEEGERMPNSGYAINETKSYCTLDNINKDNEAKFYTNASGEHIISNLAKSDKCYLYFDKKLSSGETILANVTVNEGTPDFSKTAQATCSSTSTCETTNGVYKATDNDGDTYFFRGAIENNYVSFAGYYWRIIRINGDGTIRLIYQGKEKNIVSSDTQITKTAYGSGNYAFQVGFTYEGDNLQRPQIKNGGTPSNAKNTLDEWYENNLKINEKFNGVVAIGKYCNDRTTTPGTSWVSSGSSFYYAPYDRLNANSPTLKCVNDLDVYTTNIGLITADEVIMAGGKNGRENQSYYLYTSQDYYTMTPSEYSNYSGYSGPRIFKVMSNGNICSYYIDNRYNDAAGIRPVINLRSDTKFTFTGTGEKGSMTNPYVVS